MNCPSGRLRIAVLGSGFMGTAIIKGLLTSIPSDDKNPECSSLEIHACVRSVESFSRIQKLLGDGVSRINGVTSIDEWPDAVTKADVILLGTPPDQLTSLGGTQQLCDSLQNKLIINLLAGTSCQQVLDALTPPQKSDTEPYFGVLRVIPSIGAQNLDSVTMIAETNHGNTEQKALGEWIFKQIGGIHYLPENLMDEATATHATCNALTMLAVDAMTDAAVAERIPREKAMKLVAQSFRSAAGLLDNGMTPESMKESMSVPRGITINAVLDLEKGGVRTGLQDATRNAIRYTRNMAG
ncbi:pyrroline-5-carboxylate reductase [Aureobasidium subglaciale]|nr:pyrroline-5-carboxylate reductase [Aureobasidium subglaciale]